MCFVLHGVNVVWLVVQQQRRSRTVGTQTLQTVLRKPEDKGTEAGEEVLVESMQCLLALVQVRSSFILWSRCDVSAF
jgi:hypothetical protein